MGYSCDNTHPEGVAAFIVMTQPETGDTNALCAPCLLEWSYAMLAESPAGIELLETKMREMAAEAKAAEAKPKRGGRKPAAGVAEAGEDTGAIVPAADTPDTA